MDTPIPIPAFEYLSLPAQPWLLVSLLIFTFWVHVLLAGSVVGSSFFLLVRRLYSKGRSELDNQLDGRVIKVLPVFISLTITFGVAPLLFAQSLYSHYFYSANIFIAGFWMASLGFLLTGFICVYLAGLSGRSFWSLPLLVLVVGCFVSIAYVFTNNAVLSIRPEHWLAFHRGERLLHVADPITLPRLLHNIGAFFVVGGLAVAWIGRFRCDTERANHAVRLGLRWLLFGLVVQIGIGLWYLFSIPSETLGEIAGFGNYVSVAWYLAILFVVLNLFTAAKGIAEPSRRLWLLASTALPAVGLIGMLLARQHLRDSLLARPVAGGFDIYRDWPQQIQTAPMLMFFGTLAAGLLLVAVMLIVVLRSRRPDCPQDTPIAPQDR